MRSTPRPLRRLLLASIALSGCGQGQIEFPPEATGIEQEDPPAPSTMDSASPPDSSPSIDSGDRAETGGAEPADTGVDAVPSLVPMFSPDGGSFIGSLTVELRAEEGAELLVAVDQDGQAELLPYTGPFEIDQSSVVRARVQRGEAKGEVVARAYSRLLPELEDFSSDLPLMVASTWLEAPEPEAELRTLVGLNLFEPDESGRSHLLGPPADSGRAGLKVRGSSSAGHPKHPYSLELWAGGSEEDREVPLLSMAADGDWVLYAPLVYDRGLVRNSLMYELSRLVGRWAPRTRFVELFVADRGEPVGSEHYVGVYVLVERIEVGADRLDIAVLGPDHLGEPEISGGYLYRHDRLGDGEAGFTAGTAGGAFSMTLPLVYDEPSEEEIAPAQADWLSAYLDEAADALAAPEGLHPVTGEHYEERIDIDAYLDHHILNVLAKNPDAFRLSGFHHKDRDGRLQAGPIWDFDRTMGCDSDGRADDPTWWDASNITSDTTYIWDYGWCRGLFDDPALRARYVARWEELLADELSVATMHAILDRMEGELAEAAPRNYSRWTDYPPRGGLEGELDLLRDWLADRHAWIEGCLDLPDLRDCRGE